jgi:hypothetical protein
MEIWEDIIGYFGYQVSNLGRVKSYKRGKEKILKLTYHKDYLVVSLRNESKKDYKVVSRLVAIHFLDNPLNLPLVDHKNGDRFNNSVDNLRWASYSENSSNINTKRVIERPIFEETELKSEKWEIIPFDFFNRNDLEISNLGRIKSSEKIKVYGASEKNYVDVKFNKKRYKLHILVWKIFRGDIPKGFQVGHIDNLKINNRLSNLELMTPSQNIKHNFQTKNINVPDFFPYERVKQIINYFYLLRYDTVKIQNITNCGSGDVLDVLKGKKSYFEEFNLFYQNYPVYSQISYYKGRIKAIKSSTSFQYYNQVIELVNKGFSYRKGSQILGISLDTFRTCLRSDDKIKKNITIIKELEDKLLKFN